MASKPITNTFKIQLKGGGAPGSAAPTLGQNGINVPMFSQQFNDQTKDRHGEVVPCIVTVYSDRTFSFELKLPPVSQLIKKAAGIPKGSNDPNKAKVGKLSLAQLEEIASVKMAELNAYDIKAAMKIVAGQARSMGVETERIED